MQIRDIYFIISVPLFFCHFFSMSPGECISLYFVLSFSFYLDAILSVRVIHSLYGESCIVVGALLLMCEYTRTMHARKFYLVR